MNVLFICRANAIRSQIAEALYNHHATVGKAMSAGVDLVNSIQGDDMSVPTMVCGLMDDFGVDASCQKRDWLTEDMVQSADVVVIMTDYPLPEYVKKAKKLVDWSDIPDIVSSSKDEQVRVCEEIIRRVQTLPSSVDFQK
jgi:protein-tyrosine-phosphatase